MNTYAVSRLSPGDRRAQAKVDALLAKEGITRDARLDETYGIYNDDYTLLATGSLYANTLRCLAVDSAYQGEGLLGTLVTRLLEALAGRGIQHVFLYTKPDAAKYFAGLGFWEIARAGDGLVFMENRRGAFAQYLQGLRPWYDAAKQTAAIVMNANPFSNGHQYLLERAAGENDAVHCFVVSEDISLVPFADRMALVKAGSAHLPNVTVHPSGSYIISNATFPSYFLKEEKAVTQAHAMLDIAIFAKIAEAMGITRRYIGEEPFSQITQLYNDVMLARLPQHGVECVLVPRKTEGGAAISASAIRQHIHDGNLEAIRPLVPETTFAYFASDAGKATIERIRATENVRHD